jgi:hypothetical protein
VERPQQTLNKHERELTFFILLEDPACVYVCTAPISTTLLPSSLSLREFFLHSLDSRSINPPSLGGILLLLDGVSQSRQIDTHTPPTTTAPVGGPPVRFQNKPQKNTTHFLLLTLHLWEIEKIFLFHLILLRKKN